MPKNDVLPPEKPWGRCQSRATIIYEPPTQSSSCYVLPPVLAPYPAPRVESELAAVEREALVQARAFAEAGLAAERNARLAAEQELRTLAADAEVRGVLLCGPCSAVWYGVVCGQGSVVW